MKSDLSIVLVGFFLAGLVAPLPLAAQACQGVAVPTGSLSVWLTSEDGTDKLGIGGRYAGERLYGVATIGRVRAGGYSYRTENFDWTIDITTVSTDHIGSTAGAGLILMPTSPWSVCLGAGGLYGVSTGGDLAVSSYSLSGQFLGAASETGDGRNAFVWSTAMEASVGFLSGERPAFAPRAGISFEYGGQTFGSASDTYTGFVIDVGTGVSYGRILGLITYSRVLTREFSDSDASPGTACSCPDGWRISLGVVL